MAKEAVKGGAFIIPEKALPEDVFTVNDLSEEQQLIRKTAKEFMDREVLTDEAFKRIESKDLEFTRQLMRQAAELGLLGAEIPEEYGGLNLGKVTGTIIAENVARHGSFAAGFLADTGIATYPLHLFGTKEQRQKYLPRLVSAELIGAYALTEAEAGSDAAAIKTKAVLTEDGKHYVLNGKKLYITNAKFSDVFIVFAKINGEDKLHSAFIVDKSPGIEIGEEEHKMGIIGSSTAPVFLTDVMVPAENLLGQLGMGLKIALSVLNLGRFKLAAACLGGARACLESALIHARQRKQFGKYLIEMPVIKGKMAMMAACIYAMESAVYRTAGLLDESIHGIDANDQKAVLKAISEFAIECSAIKVFCSDTLDTIIADENVQIHGGGGYIIEDKALCAAKFLMNSRINRLFEGTNEVNNQLIFDVLMRKVSLGELALMGAIKKAQSDAVSMSVEPETDIVKKLLRSLNGVKSAVLLCGGIFIQNCFPFSLTPEETKKRIEEIKQIVFKHQILIDNLGRCLTSIYIMESALAALNKHRNERDEYKVRWLFHQMMNDVEILPKEILMMCSSGDEYRTVAAMVRRLIKFEVENKKELADQIVEGLV